MKTLIVYNPKSGKGKFQDCIDSLIMALKEININEVSVFSSDRPKEITDFLFANAYKFSVLILSGGDGTLNECINALMKIKQRPKLLYIPSGTVNDVGRMLKLSKDPFKAINLLKGNPIKIDVTQINDKYFLYAAACGKFSNVSYDTKHPVAKKHLGKFYYYLRSIKNLFTKFNFKINNKENAYLFLILKTTSLGSFKLRLKPKLKLNDGKARIVIFRYRNHLSFLHFIFFMLFGDYYPFGKEIIFTNFLKIELNQNQVLNIDGEVAEENNIYNIEVHKESIEIFVEENIKKSHFEKSA